MDAQADLSLHWAHMPFCWFCHEVADIYFCHDEFDINFLLFAGKHVFTVCIDQACTYIQTFEKYWKQILGILLRGAFLKKMPVFRPMRE